MKKNYLYAIITVFLWSSMSPLVKILLGGVPNLQIISVCSYFSVLFLLLLNIKTGSIKEMKKLRAKDYLIICSLGFLGIFLYTVLYYYGLSQLTAHEACILNYLWPIMLVIFSCIILKEKMTVMKGVAMLCSFLGIVFLSTGDSVTSGGNRVVGIICCVSAAACYGLFSVLNKKADYNQNVFMMLVWAVAAIGSTVTGLIFEDWVAIEGVSWIGFIWLGVFVKALGYLLWALALKGTAESSKIANLAFLTPFIALLISAVFLKEHVSIGALFALVFIIGGILLQNFVDRRRQTK